MGRRSEEWDVPTLETISQFLCAHAPHGSRFRVKAHGEGCLLGSVIHGGLFLSRKGCRVSPPLEMGKSLHLPIHSTQWTWIFNWVQWKNVTHCWFSVYRAGVLSFLTDTQWFITKIQSPSPPASWPLANCKIPNCSSIAKMPIYVFREWKSRLLSCSQTAHWKYPTFQAWNPGSMDGYMSCIVLFLIPGWASCVTNHIRTSIHSELHVHVCNLEYAFGKY